MTYPDTTTHEWTYDRLDLRFFTDRIGRVTEMTYDDLGRLRTIKDPLLRVTSFDWCNCGGLERLTDAKGQVTEWDRDQQGRVVTKRRDNDSFTSFVYEPSTSRLWKLIDPKLQQIEFQYRKDNALAAKLYSGAAVPTPDVHYTWNPTYRRLESVQDGTGTTTFDYYPVGMLGAGQRWREDTPLGPTVYFGYDELGRPTSESIEATTMYGYSWTYDALGRIRYSTAGVTAPPWDHEYLYDGPSSRLSSVSYLNGFIANNLGYGTATQSRRLTSQQWSLSGMPSFSWAYDWNDVTVRRTA